MSDNPSLTRVGGRPRFRPGNKAPSTFSTPALSVSGSYRFPPIPLSDGLILNKEGINRMRVLTKIRDFIERLQVAYMRHKVLNQKLEGLTDHGFLDRALSGEENK